MSESVPGSKPARKRIGLAGKILIGLLLGVACGLFFGEYMAGLKIVGDIFVGLLQMTVLPYIAVGLVANIGRLPLDKGGRFATVSVLTLLGLWVIGFVVLVLAPLALPARTVASFFSTSMLRPPQTPDFLGIFVPSNIFESLSTNAVPGVVLFCILVGIALIGVRPKDALLEQLDALATALARVNGFVVRLTPVGVFAIAAAAAGTMSLEEIGRLRAYLILYTAAALVLAFWVLPALIAACTPFGRREVLRASRAALITAFATGKVLVVLPMLIENTKQMFSERRLEHEEVDPTVDVIYPLAYPFPSMGKLLALLYVPFTAWFVGSELGFGKHVVLMISGVFSMFGGPVVTIPFLLDAAELPADMFNLFLLSGVYTARVGDLLGVMHLATIGILTTAALTGFLRIRWSRVITALVVAATLLVAVIVGTRTHLARFEDPFEKGKILAGMQLIEAPVPAVVLDELAPNPVPLSEGQSRLERIRERGIVRVGFSPENLPFSYFNAAGDLVGYDVDMAHRLADDLGVQIEFVPYDVEHLADQLNADHFDLAMAGIIGTIDRSERMNLSDPYFDVHLGLVVRDHDRQEFATEQSIRRLDSPRLGLAMESAVVERAAGKLPYAEIVRLESPAEFFEGRADVDGLIISAETGAAWTVLYPGFHVVQPFDRALPLVYPLGGPDERFERYINHWIDLARRDRTIDELYDYWILGRTDREHRPRWSIIRDVLHW